MRIMIQFFTDDICDTYGFFVCFVGSIVFTFYLFWGAICHNCIGKQAPSSSEPSEPSWCSVASLFSLQMCPSLHQFQPTNSKSSHPHISRRQIRSIPSCWRSSASVLRCFFAFRVAFCAEQLLEVGLVELRLATPRISTPWRFFWPIGIFAKKNWVEKKAERQRFHQELLDFWGLIAYNYNSITRGQVHQECKGTAAQRLRPIFLLVWSRLEPATLKFLIGQRDLLFWHWRPKTLHSFGDHYVLIPIRFCSSELKSLELLQKKKEQNRSIWPWHTMTSGSSNADTAPEAGNGQGTTTQPCGVDCGRRLIVGISWLCRPGEGPTWCLVGGKDILKIYWGKLWIYPEHNHNLQ